MSAVTRMAPLGISPIGLNFSRKLPVSLIYEPPCLMMGCNIWLKNSETFSVDVSQFEMTRRPGTLLKPLCIFCSK